MTYAAEFPEFAADVHCAQMAARAPDWEDTSWGADMSPSFTCDVFVLFIDHADRALRGGGEFPTLARFCMRCEDEVMLETDDWAEVLAFMDEGKRHFDPPRIEAKLSTGEGWYKMPYDFADYGSAAEFLVRLQAENEGSREFRIMGAS